MTSSVLARHIAIVAVGVSVTLFAACSTRSGFETSGADIFGGTDADAAAANPVECVRRCSRDLKSIVADCQGIESVVEECSLGQACGNGSCMDACTAVQLSQGSTGCSFATLPPDDMVRTQGFPSNGSCYAAMIANTWELPVTISGELGGQKLDLGPSTYIAKGSGDSMSYTRLEGPLPVGEVAVVFLSQGPHLGADHTRCPSGVTPAFTEDPIAHGTTKTRAFRLTTSAPVAAYSIYPYGGGATYFPTATLLLPTSSWDTTYLGVSAWPLGGRFGDRATAQGSSKRFMQIVAAEDDTDVRLRVRGTSVVTTMKLMRNEVLQVKEYQEFNGSLIESSKPVGLFGGSECAYIGEIACDALQQQIPPLSQWGSEYALVPYRPRIASLGAVPGEPGSPLETVPWTLLGGAAGTVLSYDPERPANAPERLEQGELAYFETTDLVTVKSQDADHPFYAAVYMTGAGTLYPMPTTPAQAGDPEFVAVVPTAQFLDHYIFFTEPTYPETMLTVVRRKTAKGFVPVELGCAGEITGFRPLGKSGEYEYTWVTLTSGFAPRSFPGGTCGYGRQEARSDGPFSISVWGVESFSSYGYAAGMGSRPIAAVDRLIK